MDTRTTMNSASALEQRSKISYWIITIAFFIGMVLSLLSWLEICVQHCSANQDYRLLGLPFAIIGLTFFPILFLLHIFSWRYTSLARYVGWMVSAALGAEIMFIIIQKYQIGHWCPVCLSIAFTLSVAGIVLLSGYLQSFFASIQQGNRGKLMSRIKTALSSLSFFVLGFLIAFFGVTKIDHLQAAIDNMRERIEFGNKGSSIEVYFVSDWFCPSCHKLEPEIENLYSKIQSQVAFFFIDYPIHSKSLNYAPYNLSFLIHNKPQYFKARRMLLELTDKTESPKDDDIIAASKKLGIQYHEMPYLDVKTGMEYFDDVIREYDLNATPTIIIKNTKTKKIVKLEGWDEISEDKILKTIEKMKKGSL
jgi:thiol-disulfide isomerase/thioredoxin